MRNLRLVPDATTANDDTTNTTDSATHRPNDNDPNAWTPCCHIDPHDEFTTRNPGVLGHRIYRTAIGALEHARHSDTEAVRRSQALLDEQVAALANLDDHSARHALTGLLTGLRNDIVLTETENRPPSRPS